MDALSLLEIASKHFHILPSFPPKLAKIIQEIPKKGRPLQNDLTKKERGE